MRIYEKKNISHFRHVGRIDLFLTEKIKKVLKTHLNVCLRTSQLRRCRDTGAWTHHALFFRQQELQLFPSCTIITAADPNRRASSNLSHRARRGTHLSVPPLPKATESRRSCCHYEDAVLHHKCCHLGWLCSLDSLKHQRCFRDPALRGNLSQ